MCGDLNPRILAEIAGNTSGCARLVKTVFNSLSRTLISYIKEPSNPPPVLLCIEQNIHNISSTLGFFEFENSLWSIIINIPIFIPF